MENFFSIMYYMNYGNKINFNQTTVFSILGWNIRISHIITLVVWWLHNVKFCMSILTRYRKPRMYESIGINYSTFSISLRIIGCKTIETRNESKDTFDEFRFLHRELTHKVLYRQSDNKILTSFLLLFRPKSQRHMKFKKMIKERLHTYFYVGRVAINYLKYIISN